jgi:hypothetical protein
MPRGTTSAIGIRLVMIRSIGSLPEATAWH